MGSPVDLTLGRCSTQAPSSNEYHIHHQNGPTNSRDHLESLRKTEEHLRTLEDERRKVEGFKRELPLCIQLLEDAIKAWKEKLVNGKDVPALQLTCSSMDGGKDERNLSCSPDSRPTLEEFLPLKRRWEQDQPSEASDGGREDRGSKRPAWMTEAPLWNQKSASTENTTKASEHSEFAITEEEQSSVTSSQKLLSSKQRPTGAFLPFSREQPCVVTPLLSRPTPRAAGNVDDLNLFLGERLCSPSGQTLRASDSEVGNIDTGLQNPDAMVTMDMGMVSNGTSGAGSSSGGGNSSRKARRCWSPELHRRFVSALHQLGGSQIATPKQIRELMKVDGLTNDEVKSHLQKYRLHTRRPSSSPQSAPGGHSPQLVVLGGIWMPPQYAASASQPSSGVYEPSAGHPPQPTQFCPGSLPQDYFACINNGASGAPLQMHRQPIFETTKQAGTSQSQSSPQGPLQVTSQLSGATQGPSSEAYHDESGSEEEARSESSSWKRDNQGEDLMKNPKLKIQGGGCGNVQGEGRAAEEEVNQTE